MNQEKDKIRGFQVIIGEYSALQRLCKVQSQWGMLLSFYNSSDGTTPDELRKAVPYLSEEEVFRLYTEETLFIFFYDKKTCVDCFEKTVGDDGPTASNPYTGTASVFALTCDPYGNLRNENT